MIHTLYSNSYEVLRAVLLSNIEALRLRPEASELSEGALFRGVFDSVPVIIPSRAAQTDLARAIAEKERICASIRFMHLSEWLGFFSQEPLANVIGNEARWMIWELLRDASPGSFRAEMARKTSRLEDFTRGRSDRELLLLAQRISGVFVSYASYRLDWILHWLGLHEERFSLSPRALEERRKMDADEDAVWERALFERLARSPHWRGRAFLEHLPETLERLAAAPRGERQITLGDGRRADLPSALHVFMPFTVPPLMLPVLKAYAHSGRDVWLYLLNPSSEYWFDLVPRRLYDWKRREEGADDAHGVLGGSHREVGHPILADNGRSTRANLDRLWRFTQADDGAIALGEADEDAEGERACREQNVETHARRMLAERDFLGEYLAEPRDLRVDIEADSQSIYLEAREPKLLRRVQDSILNLDPDIAAAAESSGLPLFREDDDSLRFLAAATAVRELEGIADWIQAQLREDPSVRPEDFLVVTPDISAAAPFIDQVFGSLPEARHIDYSVTGASLAAEDASLKALTGLASLICGRLDRERLVEWLALPAISERFNFEGDDLEAAARWLAAAGFERGLTAEHLADLAESEGLARGANAAMEELMLSRALERLALGWALPEGALEPMGDVLPVKGTEEGGWVGTADRPGLLAKLSTLFSGLEALRRSARAERPAELSSGRRWQLWIGDALERFFPRETPQQDWLALRSAADAVAAEIEAAESGGEKFDVPLPIFISALADQLTRGAPAGRPGCGVTFTGMSHLRGLPYKFIVIWGLNEDSSFPGASRAEEFDLMQRFPRRGDRDRRLDNRNIFLDLLLAARRKLLISYSEGFDPANQKEPSVVAAELRSWLLAQAPDRAERLRAEKLLTKHLPLNPFSPASFMPSADAFQSTDAELLGAVEAAERAGWRQAPAPWLDAAMPDRGQTRLPFREFWRAISNPAAALLRMNGIRIPESEDIDSAPILPSPDALSVWSRMDALIRASAFRPEPEAREAIDDVVERWKLNPRMGAETVRPMAFGDEEALALSMAQAAEAALRGMKALPPVQAELSLPGFPWTLIHAEQHLWEDDAGRKFFLAVRPSALSGAGVRRALLEWALLRAAGKADCGAIVHYGKDKESAQASLCPAFTAGEAKRFLWVFFKSFQEMLEGRPCFLRPEGYGECFHSRAVMHNPLIVKQLADRGKKIQEVLEDFFKLEPKVPEEPSAAEAAAEAEAAPAKKKGRKASAKPKKKKGKRFEVLLAELAAAAGVDMPPEAEDLALEEEHA